MKLFLKRRNLESVSPLIFSGRFVNEDPNYLIIRSVPCLSEFNKLNVTNERYL